jgi:hypothetical protein
LASPHSIIWGAAPDLTFTEDINGNGILDAGEDMNSNGRLDVIADVGTTSWTSVGGLSLAIDIPKDGQVLMFSKVSGAPKLALAIRPRRSLEVGLGLIWTVVWIVLGFGAAVALSRVSAAKTLHSHVPKAMIVFGLLAFFFLPTVLAACGFGVFALGTLAFGIQHSKVAA